MVSQNPPKLINSDYGRSDQCVAVRAGVDAVGSLHLNNCHYLCTVVYNCRKDDWVLFECNSINGCAISSCS
jgi:hypothetical protein